jgi:hypothetical protein
MGVDLSISVGVGFVVQEDDQVWRSWLARVDPDDVYGGYEAIEEFLPLPDGITWGTGGSYYDDTPTSFWFCVSRLTTSLDRHDAPAGVHPLNIKSIKLDERNALLEVAKQIGITDPVITPFLSVLWH